MNSQYRCETCNKPKLGQCPINGKLFPDDFSGFMIGLKSVGCASHSNFQNQKEKVWIVAESRFEWYEIKHICGSKEIALKRWEELRDELIKEYQDMVEYCIKENYNDADNWRKKISTLKNLSPGESCDCDYPDLKEGRVELRQEGKVEK